MSQEGAIKVKKIREQNAQNTQSKKKKNPNKTRTKQNKNQHKTKRSKNNWLIHIVVTDIASSNQLTVVLGFFKRRFAQRFNRLINTIPGLRANKLYIKLSIVNARLRKG